MAKSRKTDIKETSKLNVISLPGIQIRDLLEIENLFPDIRINICTIMFAVILIGQIRVNLSSSKPAVIMSLDSVNTYIRKLLSKNKATTYVSAALAMRRTLAAHANDPDDSLIKTSHEDLIQNLSGPVTTRGGISKALSSPDDLRAYRRGLMAQLVGTLQSTPVHSPRKIHMSIEQITPQNFLPLLPFPTDDINFDEIISNIREILLPDKSQEKIIFNDLPSVKLNESSLESLLPIERVSPNLPNVSNAPKNLDDLPSWKKAAITQARNINPG